MFRTSPILRLLFPVMALAAPPKAVVSSYRLVFAEEFDALDAGKWHEGIWFSKQHTTRDHFAVGNSALSLTWSRGQPQPDTSISTFERGNPAFHAWRYGYFEARMKWRPVPGAWPAFWLIPLQSATIHSSETGEIDIFEGQGAEPRAFYGTIHEWNGSREVSSTSRHNRFATPWGTSFADYHTYGLLWVPGRVTWYFDGAPLHSEPTYRVFDTQDYFMILGMQEGADWKAGNLDGVAARNLTLTVDWVRVWQVHSK